MTKYIKYTHVDAVSRVPVTEAPAVNGPADPAVQGLQFMWARESQYPTSTPEFFGSCADEADTSVPGVLAVLNQADFEALEAQEMAARNPVPASVTMRQARLALLEGGKLDDVAAAIAAIPDATARRKAQIEWEFSNEVQRHHGVVASLGPALGLSDAAIDNLFRLAATL